MARMVRVSVASPPSFVELLSPCISAGPVAGSSALSRFCRSVPVILCLAALMPPILRGWAFCLTARLAFELLVSRLLSFPLRVVCIAPLCRSASVGSLLPVPGYVWFFAVGLASSLRRLPSYSATAFGPPAIDCGPCHEVWPSGPSCSGSCRQLLHLNCPSARRG
jgi:hypothetical protein